MKYNELNLGQIEAVVNKLGGLEGLQRFLSGKTEVKAVEAPFTVWKSIKLGTYKNTDALRKAITKDGSQISDWANDIMNKPAFTIAPSKEAIDLVLVTVDELGFPNGATYKEICEAAMNKGLEKCPAEVGPQLRLQYKNQPKDEWIRVAMDPITDSDGSFSIFRVERDVDGDRWLSGSSSHPGSRWIADNRFVFRLRK